MVIFDVLVEFVQFLAAYVRTVLKQRTQRIICKDYTVFSKKTVQSKFVVLGLVLFVCI